jgi:hypothetical protein
MRGEAWQMPRELGKKQSVGPLVVGRLYGTSSETDCARKGSVLCVQRALYQQDLVCLALHGADWGSWNRRNDIMLSKLACRDRLNAFDRCVEILTGFATELNLVVNKRYCPGRQNSEFLTESVECKIFWRNSFGSCINLPFWIILCWWNCRNQVRNFVKSCSSCSHVIFILS